MAVGLTTSLNSLVDSLNVTQAKLNYVSQNIANVGTEGYTRKTIAQETKVSSGVALGVGVSDVRRAVDDFLLTASRAQIPLVSESKTKTDYLDRIQKFALGNPNSNTTINNAVNNFYTRLEDLAGDPSSAVKRSLSVTAAVDFSNVLADLAQKIQEERFNADSDLDVSIDALNTSLTNLYDLNGAIRQNAQSSGEVSRLFDARDAELAKVKGLVQATVSFNEFGQVAIILNNSEILGISQRYELSYNRLSSVVNLINGTDIGAITVSSFNSNGDPTGTVETVVSASNANLQVNNITGGKLKALIELRDVELPKILQQLDNIAYTIANEFNEIHNGGTGFPPPSELLGVHEFELDDEFNFSGQFRITLTDSNGRPIDGRYGEKLVPMVIDLSEFDGGNGKGTATIESIISEINNHYGTQPTRIVNLGPASDIRLATSVNSVELAKATGSISFSGLPSNDDTLVINGDTFTFKTSASGASEVQIGGSLSETLRNLASKLNASTGSGVSAATYTYNATTISIIHDNAGTTGNSFTLNSSGTSVATASGAVLSGGANATGEFVFDFELSNLAPDGGAITFDISTISINSGAASAVTFNTTELTAGQRLRTDLKGVENGSLSVDLDALNLEEGGTFTITVAAQVTHEDGTVYNENLTYTITIPDPEDNIKNNRYYITSIDSVDGELKTASTSNGFLTASLVNEKGARITADDVSGFLKLRTSSGDIRISIDQLDSRELGDTSYADSLSVATNRGISHFFGLNNLFTYNDAKNNSALNIRVRSDIISSPQSFSTGRAQNSSQTGGTVAYTYELGSGSNSAILDMIKIQDTNLRFVSAGGLPELLTTMNSYATEIYNFSSLQYNNANAAFNKHTLLNDSINRKIDEISGVNVDQELAITIEIQNAYSASAKVIGVIKELFDALTNTLT
ncbi:MAG TPA: flagellar hook-associated protein FlgK [Alphaproteobacteria bacterium]|nr:flagellar hook-associated protein FlgK [Alphaproteobacteria bacterium]